MTRIHSKYARRGSGYLLVLGAAMLVSVIGLTSLLHARIEDKSEQASRNTARARTYARSAIDTAVAFTYGDTVWRTHYGTFAALMPMTLDKGACSVGITQPDRSALVTTSDDPVPLTGIGTVGAFAQPQATYKWSVAAHHPPLDILKTAAHAAGPMYVDNYVVVENGPLSTSQTLSNWGYIEGDIEARSLTNYGTITGTRTLNGPTKTMPSSTVLDYYRSRATTLSAASVADRIEWKLLSPQSNPYGTANADGLYYVKPSDNLAIRNTRIVGTLVVELRSGKVLTLEQGLLWETARPDYPALLVSGNCQMWTYATLAESGITNFNPSTTPYQGRSDTDKTDSYPCAIRGVVHSIGSTSLIDIRGSTHIIGTVIADNEIDLDNGAVLTADLNALVAPPQGYRSTWLALDPGTWTRIVP